jgi:hypothetical protein
LRLFIDSSVLLAASGSARGASREIFRLASSQGWSLIATPYVVEEVITNLPELPPAAVADWEHLRQNLILLEDVLTLDRPAVTRQRPADPIQCTGMGGRSVDT